jgi:hypothetical protein
MRHVIEENIGKEITAGGTCLEIQVNEKEHIVEFWLTNAEKNNTALRESMNPLYKLWKEKNICRWY